MASAPVYPSHDDLHRRRLYIGGEWVPAASGMTLPVINPHSEQTVGCIPAGGAADVHAAVAAARTAFDSGAWSRTSPAHRATVLRAVAEAVTAHAAVLAAMETVDSGKPIDEADWDIEDVAGCFAFYAERADATASDFDVAKGQAVDLGMDQFIGRVIKEPLGCVALITPWNYPLLMAVWKVAPALAAGCSAVLKPSEMCSLSCLKLAELIHAAGVPPGVFNVVTGLGAEAGGALVAHPDIDKIAFTGSNATGQAVMTAAAQRPTPVGLELGGKSPLVVFADADVESAVEWAMFGAFWTNGQICSATSRLLLHEDIAASFLARLKTETEAIVCADPMRRDSRLGPLVNASQYAKVTQFVQQAVAQGATLLTGGCRPPHMPTGYYLLPTVFTDVTDQMAIWREEVFGPVLAVMTFRTEAEALSLANDSPFGLAAAVLTKDMERVNRFVAGFRCGIVWVNCSQPCFTQLPWGGLKRSGFGRDLGVAALDNYCNVKQVCTYVSNDNFGWYPAFKAKL